MKCIAALLAAMSLLGATQAFAQSSPDCGERGKIIWITTPANIPKACFQNRTDNWVSMEAEGAVSAESLCGTATQPTSDITGKPIPERLMKNMSACFCGKNLPVSSGAIPMKCWTLYDRVYE